MPVVERSFVIDIPAAKIWQTFMDLENWGQWLGVRRFLSKDALSFSVEGGGKPAQGARILASGTRMPPQVWIVRDWTPPRSFHIQSEEILKNGEPRFEMLGRAAPKSALSTECYFKVSFSPDAPSSSPLAPLAALFTTVDLDRLLGERLDKVLEDGKKTAS